MDSTLKQRLIGAAVLAALAIIFLPMLLKGPDVKMPDAAEVPLSMPATPGEEYETRELPLTVPEGTAPSGGVLGLSPVDAEASETMPVPNENAVAPAPVTEKPPTSAAAASIPVPAIAPPVEKPPVAVPAETPAKSATIGAGNYVVNIGSFSNLANANALAAKLRAANLPVTADRVTLATGTAMRLRVGPYADRASAEAARLRAEGVTGAGSKVVALDAEPAGAKVATIPAPKTAPAAAPAKPASSATAATAPVADKGPRPATLSTGFAVQLSAPSIEAEALALRDRARSQGFNSFVQRIETESGVRYRVRVGPAADRSAAVSMRDAVNGKLGTKGIVVAHP